MGTDQESDRLPGGINDSIAKRRFSISDFRQMI
jgi:hypothetical protein